MFKRLGRKLYFEVLSNYPVFVCGRGLLDDSYFTDAVKKVMKEPVPYFAQYSTRVRTPTPSEAAPEEAAQAVEGGESPSLVVGKEVRMTVIITLGLLH